jgi:hypothetical protein
MNLTSLYAEVADSRDLLKEFREQLPHIADDDVKSASEEADATEKNYQKACDLVASLEMAGGVNRPIAVSMESSDCPLDFSEYPLNSFTQELSQTNYTVSMEAAIEWKKTAAIALIAAAVALIIKIIHWLFGKSKERNNKGEKSEEMKKLDEFFDTRSKDVDELRENVERNISMAKDVDRAAKRAQQRSASLMKSVMEAFETYVEDVESDKVKLSKKLKIDVENVNVDLFFSDVIPEIKNEVVNSLRSTVERHGYNYDVQEARKRMRRVIMDKMGIDIDVEEVMNLLTIPLSDKKGQTFIKDYYKTLIAANYVNVQNYIINRTLVALKEVFFGNDPGHLTAFVRGLAQYHFIVGDGRYIELTQDLKYFTNYINKRKNFVREDLKLMPQVLGFKFPDKEKGEGNSAEYRKIPQHVHPEKFTFERMMERLFESGERTAQTFHLFDLDEDKSLYSGEYTPSFPDPTRTLYFAFYQNFAKYYTKTPNSVYTHPYKDIAEFTERFDRIDNNFDLLVNKKRHLEVFEEAMSEFSGGDEWPFVNMLINAVENIGIEREHGPPNLHFDAVFTALGDFLRSIEAHPGEVTLYRQKPDKPLHPKAPPYLDEDFLKGALGEVEAVKSMLEDMRRKQGFTSIVQKDLVPNWFATLKRILVAYTRYDRDYRQQLMDVTDSKLLFLLNFVASYSESAKVEIERIMSEHDFFGLQERHPRLFKSIRNELATYFDPRRKKRKEF